MEVDVINMGTTEVYGYTGEDAKKNFRKLSKYKTKVVTKAKRKTRVMTSRGLRYLPDPGRGRSRKRSLYEITYRERKAKK